MGETSLTKFFMEIKKDEIRRYIEGNLAILDNYVEFTDDIDIFKTGFVDSLFAMKLILFIEKQYDLTIENEDMDIANFSTVNNIVDLIKRKKEINQ